MARTGPNSKSIANTINLSLQFLTENKHMACNLVVSDLRSRNWGFPVQVRLLTMCRGEFYAVISRLISECLWSSEAERSGSVELKKCPPPSPTVLWFMNSQERKLRWKKKVNKKAKKWKHFNDCNKLKEPWFDVHLVVKKLSLSKFSSDNL